ncbi:MAG: peptidoglycan-binding protein [Clostridia bacterium]|nr:peptidoglycan-binding protein [Clostridia bacterium]
MSLYPTIPKDIVVHLGAPSSDAQNVTVSFSDYIKNVASSEIYPTWPIEAIKANVLAQISVALNRVYTGYYRNRGYDFDITNSPAYDQTFIYQRNVYESISSVVDQIYDSYIRRLGRVEPLFAQFCDGVEITCNGLQQWDTVEYANQGLNYEEIIRRSYGNDVEIITDVPQESGAPTAPLEPLSEGDSGAAVEIMQIRLNRISANYPGIPKIYPTDGFFDVSTANAVRKFQEVFNLTPDGIIGPATWNRVNAIYGAVKDLYSISSEGLTVSELATAYERELREGVNSPGVFTLQYYLAYISLFIPTVESPTVDGSFGTGTRDSVISFQKTYGLPETGIVDERTWNTIEDVYYGILEGIPYEFEEGLILPYPGRVLRVGSEGDDVRALQGYLNYISGVYPEIPRVSVDGVFGESTAEAVRAFNTRFDLPTSPERVNAQTWNAIVNVYDDLYTGSVVREDQFPGYNIG